MPHRKTDPQELSAGGGQLARPSGAEPAHYLPKVETGRLFGVLLRRGWLVVLCVVLCAAVAAWYAGKQTPMYRAEGSVYVGSQAPTVLDIQAVSQEETRDLEEMRSVEQGMSASTLLLRVIEENDLKEDSVLSSGAPGEQSFLRRFAGRVSVGLRRGTRIIDISVDDTDPERARLLVESLVAEYEKWTTERQREITKRASEGLAQEEIRLKAKMEERAKKLQEFREGHAVPGLEGAGTGAPRDPLGALQTRLTQATAERLQLEAEYESFVKFASSDPDSLAGIGDSPRGAEVLALVRSQQAKETEFARVKERYGFKHPVYREIDNEIKMLKAQLNETVSSASLALEQRYNIAKENELKLSSELAFARGTAVSDAGVREEFRSMTRAAEADRALYESVARRLRETTLAASVPASVLRWEDTPLTPEHAHGPGKFVFAVLGAFGGFVLGALLMVGSELGDRKVRNAASAARATGTPMLVSVPSIGGSGDGMLLVSDPESPGAEAFRRLSVVLAPPPGTEVGRTILFASARAGEGKSFCALNHATALATQGHRTLLVDADLRSAGLSREHIPSGVHDDGLGGFLAGKVDPASACHATSLPNLYMLSSGPMRGDAAELLAGTRLPSLLEDAYKWFDRVVIDTPPVLAVSDALTIARYSDRCCLVVREGGGDRRELKRAADLMRSAGGNLVGFVWNESPKGGRDSGSSPVVRAQRVGIGSPDQSCPDYATPNLRLAMVGNPA